MNFWGELNKIEELTGSNDKEDYIVELIENFTVAETYFRIACGGDVFGLAEKSFWNAFEVDEEKRKEYNHVSDWLAETSYQHFNQNLNEDKLLEYKNEMLKLSGARQLKRISYFFIRLSKNQQKWLCRALLHDLRCGVKRKTVNKAFKRCGLKKIKKFSLMLAGKFKNVYDKEEVCKKITFPCSGEIKEDGIRLQVNKYVDNDDEDITLLTSRRGKDKTADYPEICQAFNESFKGENVILDGEIVSSSFQELTRKDSKANKKFVAFDILNDETLPYKYRWSNLQGLLLSKESDKIVLVDHFDINNYEELIHWFEYYSNQGEEGIMVKLDDKPYKRNSRTTMFKFKKVYTADLKIIGFNYGEGKRAGKVGSLKLETADGELQVDVGSGITDEICDELTEQTNCNPIGGGIPSPEFIGKICEIKYSELTETGSIRFPVFKCIREDKENADRKEDLETR